MKRLEASYTVELALLLPVLLFALFAPVYLGYNLYGQVKEASVCSWDEKFCAAREVRGIKTMEDIRKE